MSKSGDQPLDKTLPDVQSSSQSELDAASVCAPGDIIGGTYLIQELIGKGGMGYVFCAEHTIIGQKYALKILPPEQINETNWRRFQSEGKAIAKLNHQNIVRIHNMGVDRDRCPYYVMDLLYGASLSELIEKTGPLPLAVAIEIFLQLCQGLSYAHRVGVIHRDMKPNNVILQNQPVAPLSDKDKVPAVKIVDFGLARLIRIEGDSLQRITSTGEIFGTPLYMSPEQCMGVNVDNRADIYSLGCALYETLTGQPPFRGENAMATVLMHMEVEPRPLSQAFPQGGFSQSVELLIAKMLKKDPRQRYQTMDQVGHDLERIKLGKSLVPTSGSAMARTEPGPGEQSSALAEIGGSNNKEIVALVAVMIVLVCLIGAVVSSLMHIGDRQTDKVGVKPPATVAPAVAELTEDQEKLKQTFATMLPFSRGLVGLPGHQGRVFQFPKDYSVGSIGMQRRQYIRAQDTVTLPANEPPFLKIDFGTGVVVEQMPEILRKFDAGDICGVEFNSLNWAACARQMYDWNRLDTLIFDKSQLKANDIPVIDTLTNLKSLQLEKSEFNVPALARLRILRQLKDLVLSGSASEEPILKAIAGSQQLRVFSACEWPCSALGLSYLAQCPNLKDIYLTATDLRDQDIMQLEKMPHLRLIHFRKTKLTPRCIPYLRRLHSLKKLYLKDLKWPERDRVQLQQAINAYIEF